MEKRFLLGGLLLLFLAACQPEVIEVEVTRLVEIEQPTETETALFSVTAAPPSPEPQVIEVTRIVTKEVAVEAAAPIVTEAPLGSAERPVQLLFPPDAGTAVINLRAQAVADTISDATGLEFAIGVTDSEEAMVELICTAPADTIAFLSSLGYVMAHEQCGAQLGSVAVNTDGLTWQAGMIVTRRERNLRSIEDLAGLRGAVPDESSLHNAAAVKTMLLNAGVEPEEIIEVQGDNAAMLAVFEGDVDFAVGTFTPPIMPEGEDPWQYGVDQNEIWRFLGLEPERSPIGYVLVIAEPEFGGYRIRDARSGVFDIQPEIFNATRITELTPQIPNETVAFGAEVPIGLAQQVMDELQAFTASETCTESLCSSDFFNWTGLEPTNEAFYQPLRDIVAAGVVTSEMIDN
jgi:ABC-type phosphate/phosphonate transport system substrate-binding protein